MRSQTSEVIVAAMGLIRAGKSALASELLAKRFPNAAVDETTRALGAAKSILDEAEYLAVRHYEGIVTPEGAVFRLREKAPFLTELEAQKVFAQALFDAR